MSRLCGHFESCSSCSPYHPAYKSTHDRKKTGGMTSEEIRTRLVAYLGWKTRYTGDLRLTWSDADHEPSYVTLTFSGPLTFSILRKISEFFETEDIDVEGNHGDGSYDVGLEVELRVGKPRTRPA